MKSFNVAPYYDDYDPSKNFHKILFVPGNPVQARELTQIQSILQEQIKRHGDHIFKNGTVVLPGDINYNNSIIYLKVESSYAGVSADANISNLIGQTISGNGSGVTAKIVHAEASTDTDPTVLFIQYLAANGANTKFQQNETVLSGNGITLAIQNVTDYTGFGAICQITDGIFYVNGYFVGVSAQTVVLSRFTSTPSSKVGLLVNESVVTSVDDESLFDNALGFSNYGAPGAHRYKIQLDLVAYDYSFDTQPLDPNQISFIELLQVKSGQIEFEKDFTEYAAIQKMLARRTFDESGDYIVNPFTVQVFEARNNYRGSWVASTVYLKGDVVSYIDGNNQVWYYYARNEGLSGVTAPTHTAGLATDGVIYWQQTPYPVKNNGLMTPTATNIANTLEAHKFAESKYVTKISSGKAYIKGYEVWKRNAEYIVHNKARTTQSVASGQVFANTGSYVLVTGISGSAVVAVPNTDALELMDIYKDATNKIGTLRVKSIELVSGTPGSGTEVYRLGVFGINMIAGQDFQYAAYKIASQGGGSGFAAYLVTTTTQLHGLVTVTNSSSTVTGKGTAFQTELQVGAKIYVPDLSTTNKVLQITAIASDTSLTAVDFLSGAAYAGTTATDKVFSLSWSQLTRLGPSITPMAHSYIQTIRDTSGTIRTSYTVNKRIPFTTSGTSIVITLTGGETFDGLTGHMVALAGSPYTIINPGYSLDGTSTQLTITGLSASTSYVLLGRVKRSTTAAKEKTKTLSTATMTITTSGTFTASKIALNEADVVRVTKITQSGDPTNLAAYSATNEVDITSRYVLDTGQRQHFYDLGSISLKTGQTAATRPIKIVFEYFDHSTGDYFSVDSYSGIPYEMIPNYTDNDGVVYYLRDCLDFRSRIADSGADFTSTGASVSTPLTYGTVMSMDYAFYLPRIDEIWISDMNIVSTAIGIPSLYPVQPNTPTNGMSLAKISVDPYTLYAPKNVVVTLEKHQVYTMKDIYELDVRLGNVEQYVALSLLEKKTSDLKVYDQFGLERFKNGFIVDAFQDLKIAATDAKDYRASIDLVNAQLRPDIKANAITLIEPQGTTPSVRVAKGYTVRGRYASLPFTERELVSQPMATRGESINPFGMVNFRGTLELFPSQDSWMVDYRIPDQVTTIAGNYNDVASRAGTQWNDWSGPGNTTTVVGSEYGVNQAATGVVIGGGVGVYGYWGNEPITAQQVQSQAQRTETRTGTQTTVQAQLDQLSRTTNVVSQSIIGVMRARSVVAQLKGMRPFSTFYPFLDGTNISYMTVPCKTLVITGAIGTFQGYDGSALNNNTLSSRTSTLGAHDIYGWGEVITSSAGGTAVVVAQELQYNPNTLANELVLKLANVKGTFAASNTITGGTSNATATVSTLRTETDLQANSLGNMWVVLTFLDGSFTTGTKTVKFVDNAQGSEAIVSSSASATYTAKGVYEVLQDTVLLQQNATLLTTQLIDTRTVTDTNVVNVVEPASNPWSYADQASAPGSGDAGAAGCADGGSCGGDGGGGGGGGGGGKIICTALFAMGMISAAWFAADQQYGRELYAASPTTYRGYRVWADWVVSRLNGTNKKPYLTRLLFWKSRKEQEELSYRLIHFLVDTPTKLFVQEIAYRKGVAPKSTIRGWMLVEGWELVCNIIGRGAKLLSKFKRKS